MRFKPLAAALIILGFGLAAPAVADIRTTPDRHGDTSSRMDIYSVRVNNSLPNLKVTTNLRSIQRAGSLGGGLEVYVDTRSASRGPEYVLGTGVNCNCDWEVFKLRPNWGTAKGAPLLCRSGVRWSVRAATVTTSFSRACVGHAARVRVSVRASGPRGGTDWAPARRRFTRWVNVTQTSTPVMNDCFASKRRPRHWQVACGDGNGYFDQATWTHWGKAYATGTARVWDNTCNPDCAAGNYHKYRVNIRLDRVRTTSNGFYFERLGWGRTTIRHHYPLPPRALYPGQG